MFLYYDCGGGFASGFVFCMLHPVVASGVYGYSSHDRIVVSTEDCVRQVCQPIEGDKKTVHKEEKNKRKLTVMTARIYVTSCSDPAVGSSASVVDEIIPADGKVLLLY